MSRDRVFGGHLKPHICNKRPQFAYSLYNFYGDTMTIKGSLHGTSLIVKQFSAERFVQSKAGPIMAVLRNKGY